MLPSRPGSKEGVQVPVDRSAGCRKCILVLSCAACRLLQTESEEAQHTPRKEAESECSVCEVFSAVVS